MDRKFNRVTLEENRIFFFETIGEYGQMPAHVNSLRDALLDFECTLPTRLSFYDEDEFEDTAMLHSVMNKLFVSESERASIEKSVKTYRDMKREAQRLDNGCDREAEWVKFYEKNFLDKLFDEFVITDEDSRRVARTKFYYDDFDVAKERRWGLFSGPGDLRKEYGKSNLTMPVPDWVAYFRVYDLKSSWGRIRNSSSRWPWANSAKNKIVENFSLATLQELAEHGLQFSVANNLRGNRNSSIVPSDLLCYPWLITEYKRKDKEGEVQCYCQAANAGAASLMLLQTLIRHSTYKTVLPVVTMTTWGPEVRIWICFFDDSLKSYQGFGDNHPVFDPDTKIPLFKRPTPPPNDTFLRLSDKTRGTSRDSNHSSRRANTSNTGDGPATPRLELDSSNPEEATSGQTPRTPVSKHMFNSQTDWDFGTPSKTSANARPTSSDSRPRTTQPLSSGSSSKIPQTSPSSLLGDKPNLSNHQQSNETSPAEAPSPPLGSNSIERKRWFPSPFGAQSLSSSSPPPFRLPSYAEARPDSDAEETDLLDSLRDLFRLPQIESSDEIWSPSRAKSPVPRWLRDWVEFNSPLLAAITRCAGGPGFGGSDGSDGYPYLTYERGEVLDVWGIRGKYYLAQRVPGCDNPKGWVWSANTTLIDAQTGRSLETTGSSIHKPDSANSLTEANQTPELIKSDTNVLGKGPPSPAFQRSPATASLETTEAGRRNVGLASVAKDDVTIRKKKVRCGKTGRLIFIKLPNRPIKERRLSIEYFAHPPRFAYAFTSTTLPASGHEDGPPPVRPPDLASLPKEPPTSAAEHGSGTDVSTDQTQSPPSDERPEVGLFGQSNRGDFKGGLFDGLDTNGWKPRSIPNRDEERQLCSDSGPSKPTMGTPFRWCPSPSSSQQKGNSPSDASKAPVQASLSGGVKTSTPTTPGLFGNSNAFKSPKENSVSDEKQTSIFKIGPLSSHPYTPIKKPRLSVDFCSTGWKPIFGNAGTETSGEQSGVPKEDMPDKDDVAAEEPLRDNGHTKEEAPLQPESSISADEDWETADEE
ncbi:hypothetical protein DL767_000867 [Monosporascus sp. MG133]|nr:hypothetical protein DL767_000867 [Monosporascus sp. MG133]